MSRKIIKIEAVSKIFEANTPNNYKRRVAAYARVSTSSDEQLLSIEAQKDYYPKFIATYPNWEFVGLYADEGISGTSSRRREEFNRMIADALNGKIDLIITKSISRFARNTVDTLTAIRKLKDANVEVFFEKEGINTLRAEGELLLSILASIAEEERKQISTNLKWAFRNKFKRGEAIISTTNRLLGYERNAEGHLVVSEEQARITRYIFKLYSSGLSSQKVAERLNAEQVPTFTLISRNRPSA